MRGLLILWVFNLTRMTRIQSTGSTGNSCPKPHSARPEAGNRKEDDPYRSPYCLLVVSGFVAATEPLTLNPCRK